MTFLLRRLVTATALAGAMAGAAVGASAGTATASTAQAAEPASVSASVTASPSVSPSIGTSCNGNYLCMDAPVRSGSNWIIRDWAPVHTFAGHFELQTPDHKVFNSKSKLNHIGRQNGWRFTVRPIFGRYCSTAWKDLSKTRHVKLGFVCYRVV